MDIISDIILSAIARSMKGGQCVLNTIECAYPFTNTDGKAVIRCRLRNGYWIQEKADGRKEQHFDASTISEAKEKTYKISHEPDMMWPPDETVSEQETIGGNDVKKAIEKAYSFPSSSPFEQLPKNFVKDEDQTVRWNRRYVEDYNEKIRAQNAEMRQAREQAIREAQDLFARWIMQRAASAKITKQDAQAIIAFAKRGKTMPDEIQKIMDEAKAAVKMLDHMSVYRLYDRAVKLSEQEAE